MSTGAHKDLTKDEWDDLMKKLQHIETRIENIEEKLGLKFATVNVNNKRGANR